MASLSSVSEVACTITSAGISAPTYDQILEWLQNQYKLIYGSDIILDNSTQDGQWIGILAQAINVSNQVTIVAFNSFSPAKAQGAALSSNVKINGIARVGSTSSTCDVTISGTVGTTITNGTVRDTAGNYTWALPTPVVIPPAGMITVTASCTTSGAISADIGTLTVIGTPTNGWTSVTNASPATPGENQEQDATLRVRQSNSTMTSAYSIMDALTGAIGNLTGVTTVKGYDNDTDAVDANGIPANNIALVVEGGDAVSIATIIANKKGMGVPTYGTTTEVITDNSGKQRTINFFRPTDQNIYVNVTLKALANYTTDIGAAISAAVANYIASQDIGSVIYISRLFSPATLADTLGGLTYDILSIEIGTVQGSLSAANIVLPFTSAPICPASNVVITAT